MRMRLPIGRMLFFLVLFLLSLLAFLPLRLVLDWLDVGDHGFAARETRGSVWYGALADVQLGSVQLGTVQARLRTLPLLIGRARVDLMRGGDIDPLVGAATVTPNSFGLDDVTARLGLGAALAPLPVGSVDLRDVTARFADGRCDEADGLVTAQVAGQMAGLALPGGLSGTARCDAGALLLPLASQSGMETLSLRLWPNGRYRADLALRLNDPAIAPRMTALGFTATATGYRRRVEGSLSGPPSAQ